MLYKWLYKTPNNFDDILMYSDGKYLIGLWFIGSKNVSKYISDCEEKDLAIFEETRNWLDIYFSGKSPNFTPKYKINSITKFRKEVLNIVTDIPFGSTLTYNDISKILAKKRELEKMSAQAVGGAIGWNPICIIIPCHRVIGTNGNLTGYSGGIKNKQELLVHEKTTMAKYLSSKKEQNVEKK